MNRIKCCLALCGLLTLAVVVPSTPASAAACGVKKLSYFVGYSGSIANIEGASSYLTLSQPSSYCPGGTGVRQISAWVMLASADRGSYAQIGVWRTTQSPQGGYSDHVFTQKTVNSTFNGTYVGANADLIHHYAFRVLYSPGCGCLQMSVDGSVKDSTPYNPFGNWGQPFSPQYLGEAYYREDLVIGRNFNRAKFDGLGVQDLSENIGPAPCGLTQSHDAWNVVSSGCQVFYIWGA